MQMTLRYPLVGRLTPGPWGWAQAGYLWHGTGGGGIFSAHEALENVQSISRGSLSVASGAVCNPGCGLARLA